MVDALLKRIATAYANVPRPEIITKRVAKGIKEQGQLTDQEQAALYALDPETHWSQLTDEDIRAYDDVLPFLDNEGFLFYLPAFMSYTLRVYDGLYTICSCQYRERFQLFNAQQMRCVFDFLTFCTIDIECHKDVFYGEYAAEALVVVTDVMAQKAA